MAQKPGIYAFATMDSKGEELAFVARAVRDARVGVVTVDVGTLSEPSVAPDVSRREVARGTPWD